VQENAASTGDIYGDLIQALNRRRKGIAEKQQSANNDDNSNIAAPPTADADWE